MRLPRKAGTSFWLMEWLMAKDGAVKFFLPVTLEEALQYKAEFGERGRFVAGGTDLVLQVGSGLVFCGLKQ